MTYDDTRDSEQLQVHDALIDEFTDRIKTPHGPTPWPRQTVFFFPGGMACQLKRARERFQDGAPAQNFSYDCVWLTLESFLGGALDLAMHRDVDGVWRDKDDRIVVADGSVNFLGCSPHDGFVTWCAANNIDLYVFNWDWRRRPDETAKFFVDKFLPHFQARVLNANGPDPLANFSLVGHSLGGMIVNLVLRRNDPIVANMSRAITVATPFYGYAGQVHRWFAGEPLLNGPFNLFRREMIEVISSLPALYTLNFLDSANYDANQPLLANDGPLSLTAYPSMDTTAPPLRADPYRPQVNGGLVRYPQNLGFDVDELGYGWDLFLQMNYPILDPVLERKFYNIRGVRTERDGVTLKYDTVGSVTWDWIPPNFNPADPSPIVDVGYVPGDNTQPAWSTRLVTNQARCISVCGHDLDHMFLMSSSEILNAISTILCRPTSSVQALKKKRIRKLKHKRLPRPAPPHEVKAFLEWLYQYKWMRNWQPLADEDVLKKVPKRFKSGLGRIARGIMSSIMMRPPQTTPPGKRHAPPAEKLPELRARGARLRGRRKPSRSSKKK